eukprot:TRINITY_DN6555_c0_g1_i1.p1 TRINITY_DN6555_c0_g1~~TRINITY_DN6555_c0_g1_i1.p1  ORF type:complete len:509 (+),score=147.53 TRINITY_DN6555_c0_g1_i1:148-1674(+)
MTYNGPMATAMPDFQRKTMANILCCMCGIPIQPNQANMCVNCIRGQVDITDGIPKQLMLMFCRGCGRYLNPPDHWVMAELESKELLSLCIKKIKGLNKVKLIDAGFVWTEPHSKRIKVKLTVQKEVFTSTILQQVFVVEFVVQGQQCDTCAKYEAKDTWNAVCQIRQRVDHKKTFYMLEQLILRHGAHTNTLTIKEKPDGLDFFYGHKSHAAKMLDFLQAVIPIRFKTSEKLISQDDKSNTANYKHTFSIEVVPICRDDLVCMPIKLARSLGNVSPLLICHKVSTMVHLIDPLTSQTCELSSNNFWMNPFRAISSTKQLVQFIVLDITPVAQGNGKYVIADAQVARVSDFGSNDTIFNVRTHLGHLLNPGDYALGYDLTTLNVNDDDISSLRSRQMPDIMLVKKNYPERRKKNRTRHWKLKTLDKETSDDNQMKNDSQGHDYESFMQDLEEDPELRSQVQLYKAKDAEHIYQNTKKDVEEDLAENQEDFPEVALEELLEDLSIQDHQY